MGGMDMNNIRRNPLEEPPYPDYRQQSDPLSLISGPFQGREAIDGYPLFRALFVAPVFAGGNHPDLMPTRGQIRRKLVGHGCYPAHHWEKLICYKDDTHLQPHFTFF